MTVRGHLTALVRDAAFGTALVALRVVLMAHSAWMMGDAIVRTLYRMFISRQNLLEWRTASDAHKSDPNGVWRYYRQMYGAVVIAIIGLAIPVVADSTGTFVAFFFAVFWIGSPAFAWLISRSAETEDRLRVTDADRVALRTVARRTWAYFETFVTAEHNMLPPDNFQETPQPVVAQRTSPTNVGVYLLSVVSARDFGWISLADAARRIEATMSTLEKMQRHRGHLFNWYDTKTLKPLLPLYVSSVDSGNLAGHLLAVAAACADWAEAPAVHLQGDFDGILDCLTVLDESLSSLPDDRRQLRPLRQRLLDRIVGMRRAVHTIKTQPEMASIRTINLTVQASEVRKLAIAIDTEAGSAASGVLAQWASRLEATCEAHVQDAHSDDQSVAALRKLLVETGERARRYRLRDGFLVPVQHAAQAAVDRLPRRAAPDRRELLRPAGLGSAADQPVRHRQGRPADRALVQARPADRRDRLPGRADVVVGLDVRVSDAAAGDEGAARRHPQPDQPPDHQAADPVRPLQAYSVGHLGSRLQRPRPRTDLPVHQFRRARPRAEARPGAQHRDCALCDGACRAVHAGRGGRQSRPAEAARRARPLRLLRRRRLHAAARAGRQQPGGGAELHGASPGHVDRRRWPMPCSRAACATASTATR